MRIQSFQDSSNDHETPENNHNDSGRSDNGRNGNQGNWSGGFTFEGTTNGSPHEPHEPHGGYGRDSGSYGNSNSGSNKDGARPMSTVEKIGILDKVHGTTAGAIEFGFKAMKDAGMDMGVQFAELGFENLPKYSKYTSMGGSS